MKDALLAAARALDGGRWEEAREHLRSAPLVRCDLSQRLVAAALWKRILVSSQNSIPAGEGGETALLALNEFRAAARNAAYVWRMYQAIPVLIERIGAPDAAAIVATTAWDRILGSHPAVFSSVFEVFYQAGGRRCIDAWEQFLAEQKNYAPSYWHFVLLMKCFVTAKHADFAAMAIRSLRRVQREDLTPLLAVYLQQMQQAPVAEIAAAARALTVANQRARVAEYVIDMGYAAEELPVIVTAFAALVGDSDADKAALALMQARLANAERRWRDTLELAERARAEPRHRQAADLLRAHALAGMNEAERAITVLDEIVAEPETAHFQRARATFIRVTAELARRGLPALQERPRKAFPATPGRPLAQSLRVGRKLRWIERLAIKSYLDNGWRFQLYAYDDPDNVPDGCEVLDAAAIIPAKDVFREGAGSGSHAGSLGAFPDLFRYQLLYKRGGMWTDTDVINLRKFDPDGQRFIATEITDAGIVSLNGAMMAAPAGDALMARAYQRACVLLAANDRMFFTRIGPYLLAELVIEMGVDGIELMPPGFLSPVSWMNTASLLQPFERMMAREDIRQAVNLHVYTEMWRTLGLGLDRPPGRETFIGRLYADHLGEENAMQEAVNA
jgi:hypothetical protein